MLTNICETPLDWSIITTEKVSENFSKNTLYGEKEILEDSEFVYILLQTVKSIDGDMTHLEMNLKLLFKTDYEKFKFDYKFIMSSGNGFNTYSRS